MCTTHPNAHWMIPSHLTQCSLGPSYYETCEAFLMMLILSCVFENINPNLQSWGGKRKRKKMFNEGPMPWQGSRVVCSCLQVIECMGVCHWLIGFLFELVRARKGELLHILIMVECMLPKKCMNLLFMSLSLYINIYIFTENITLFSCYHSFYYNIIYWQWSTQVYQVESIIAMPVREYTRCSF